jgi:hypothetical protein
MIAMAGEEMPGAPGCLPNKSQRLLLKAACAPGDIAAPAWRSWVERHGLAHPDPISMRLHVWIFRRRKELNLSSPEIAALEPAYRYAWLTNQRLLNNAALVLRTLAAHGFDALLLKGLPLLIDIYRDEGARYMEDFDIMVRRQDLQRLVPVLAQLNWKPLTPGLSFLDILHLRHSDEFSQPGGLSCDVHWRLLRPPNKLVNEEPLWTAKRPIRIRDVAAYTLSVEHMLLHLFVHGMSWERVPPIRWILDVHLLLQRHQPDWDSLLREANRRGVTLPVAEAMAAYNDIAPGEIPEPIHLAAARLHPTRKQKLAYEQIARPYEQASWRVVLAVHIAHWKQARALGNISLSPRKTIRHLCSYWRVNSPWKLPIEFARRLRRRLRNKNTAS